MWFTLIATVLNANIAAIMYCAYIWKTVIKLKNKSYILKGNDATSSEIITGKVILIINSSQTELSNSLTKALRAD